MEQRIAAVIAEYNPFHNGHAWQVQTLREMGFTHIAAVISPDYVQRGAPALLDKRTRVKAALLNGIDLALELPLPYALAPAERFAFGGVSLVHAMGCVDSLAFGAETPSLPELERAAAAAASPMVMDLARQFLSEGRTFAQARQLAVQTVYGQSTGELFSRPNNNLAIEYLRQLKQLDSAVKPLPLPRMAVEHDSRKPDGLFASATLLRGIAEESGFGSLRPYVPESAWELYQAAARDQQAPALLASGERAILGKLRSLPRDAFASLPDLSEGIENRFAAAVASSCSVEELAFAVKTKRYTLARVRRLILSAFLEIPGSLAFSPPPYFRILGLNRRGEEILRRMKKASSLPISASLAGLRRLSAHCAEFAQLEASASDLYSLFLPAVRPCGLDYTEKAVFLKQPLSERAGNGLTGRGIQYE